ncbi:hypothetical protein BDV12DRAFT_97153 [Aspergillus spectabilis]
MRIRPLELYRQSLDGPQPHRSGCHCIPRPARGCPLVSRYLEKSPPTRPTMSCRRSSHTLYPAVYFSSLPLTKLGPRCLNKYGRLPVAEP